MKYGRLQLIQGTVPFLPIERTLNLTSRPDRNRDNLNLLPPR
jgi:hypothetical protein